MPNLKSLTEGSPAEGGTPSPDITDTLLVGDSAQTGDTCSLWGTHKCFLERHPCALGSQRAPAPTVVVCGPQQWVAAAPEKVAPNTCNVPCVRYLFQVLLRGWQPLPCPPTEAELGPWSQGVRPVFPAYPQAPALLPITAPWAGFTQLRAPELLCALGYFSLRGPQAAVGSAYYVSGACCHRQTPQSQGSSYPHPPSVLCFQLFSSTGHHHPSHETLP